VRDDGPLAAALEPELESCIAADGGQRPVVVDDQGAGFS
jgi:hypothetical protein